MFSQLTGSKIFPKYNPKTFKTTAQKVSNTLKIILKILQINISI